MAIGAFSLLYVVRAVRVVRFLVFSSSWLPAEQTRAYRLCSESFYRVTNCADFVLAYANVTYRDIMWKYATSLVRRIQQIP